MSETKKNFVKDEQAKIIAEALDITQAKARECIDAVAKMIVNALNAGHKVTIQDLGTFDVTLRAERTGHNPMTGATMTIPAKNVVKFKATKSLNELINA